MLGGNMKDKIITFILTLLIIIILGGIGIFGYIVYTDIMKEGTIQIRFEEDTVFPTIEYTPSNKNSINIDENIFNGVEGSTTASSNEMTETVAKQSRHLYNQLDDTAKTIYTKLYQNKENLKTGTYKIDFGDVFQSLLSQENGDVELKKQYQSSIEALVYENPDIFYLDVTKMYLNIEKITKITGVKYNVFIDNGNETSYLTNGFYSKEDIEEYEKQIEKIKNQMIAQVDGKTDYQKIKMIHDYLIDSIEYESDLTQNNVYNIYGALVNKRCVCEGYAKAFQYLMNESGIENTIIIGTGTNSRNQTESHAWNYVKLDGQWYAVDVTWDDPILSAGGKLTNQSRYANFLKGSKTMSVDHFPSGKFTQDGQTFEYPTLSVEDYKE